MELRQRKKKKKKEKRRVSILSTPYVKTWLWVRERCVGLWERKKKLLKHKLWERERFKKKKIFFFKKKVETVSGCGVFIANGYYQLSEK
jgi:CRISPR/Cas system Type II protein with McrA/HNH and RuvC-like nuclease domain